MFWDGTRWIDERAPAAPPPPSRRRARDWLATGVMILGIAALAIPFAATTAASSSGDRLMASWVGSFHTRVFQESTVLASYAGTWVRRWDGQFLGAYAAGTTQAGAVVDFTFTGSGVSWIGPKGPNQGKARVYLDGRYVRTVDNYSPTLRPRESLFTASFSDVTQHTLAIHVLASSARRVVTVDALLVRGTELTVASAEKRAPLATPTPTRAPAATPTHAPTHTLVPTPVPIPTAAPSATPAPKATPVAGFVQRSGTSLMLAGEDWKPVGLNFPQGVENPVQACAFANAMRDLTGLDLARVWTVQAAAVTGGVRDWQYIDLMLARAEAYGRKVIMVLTDQHQSPGQSVHDTTADRDLAWYQTGYATTVDVNNTVTYKAWVREIVARYRTRTSIAMWELVNEPQPWADETTLRDVLRAFADDMAATIKGIDHNHLVSFGITPWWVPEPSLSGGMWGLTPTNYAYIHAGPDMDVASYHEYIGTGTNIPGDAVTGLGAVIASVHAVGKVLIVGESGMDTQALGISTQQRADAFAAERAAQFAAGSSGFLMWTWGGPAPTQWTMPMDILLGDPALAVLAKHAARPSAYFLESGGSLLMEA